MLLIYLCYQKFNFRIVNGEVVYITKLHAEYTEWNFNATFDK